MTRYLLMTIYAIALIVSCDDFLDEMPDNRTEIDTEEKVEALLVSAYPVNTYSVVTELMSDNVDDMGENNPYTDRFYDQCYAWEDITETNNDDVESFWQASYNAIAAANQSLNAIEEIASNSGWTTALEQCKAEALLCRAYNHFMLINVFSKHYNSVTSESDLGITYMTEPETTLSPAYDRQSVAECYRLIKKDIEEALPLTGESYMSVPKYHFNRRAAYAFASRFYLYYEMWDKAIECANNVLGDNPVTMLRDYTDMAQMTQDIDAISQHYIDATLNCNLLLTTSYSSRGLIFGPYYLGKRYSHASYLDKNETLSASYPWGSTSYYMDVKVYSATNVALDIFWKIPYLFEYTDAVAGIGYYHSVQYEFTCDETLIDRAEAEIMLHRYDDACEDIALWLHNIAKSAKDFDPETVKAFYNSISYSYDRVDTDGNITRNDTVSSTVKKHLNPSFSIGEEGSIQESMLQLVLGVRRIQTIHEGKRWFDIKRYGIEIPRRVLNSAGNPFGYSVATSIPWLLKDDERRAIQVPQKVISSGYKPNPRDDSNGMQTTTDEFSGKWMIPVDNEELAQ